MRRQKKYSVDKKKNPIKIRNTRFGKLKIFIIKVSYVHFQIGLFSLHMIGSCTNIRGTQSKKQFHFLIYFFIECPHNSQFPSQSQTIHSVHKFTNIWPFFFLLNPETFIAFSSQLLIYNAKYFLPASEFCW